MRRGGKSNVVEPSQVDELKHQVKKKGPHHEEYQEHDEAEDAHDDVQPDVEEKEAPKLDSYLGGSSNVCPHSVCTLCDQAYVRERSKILPLIYCCYFCPNICICIFLYYVLLFM